MKYIYYTFSTEYAAQSATIHNISFSTAFSGWVQDGNQLFQRALESASNVIPFCASRDESHLQQKKAEI